MSLAPATAFWRAVGLLRLDRVRGLLELEACFAAGMPPDGLDGQLRGRLLATTVGHGLDRLFEAATRVWMPWLGKTIDGAAVGRNDFIAGAGRLMRVSLPRYADLRVEGPRRCSAFFFLTSTGPSALDPSVKVLRIDYREVPDNPSWPVRRVLDELVAVAQLFLGQALLEWRGALGRAAWFSLER